MSALVVVPLDHQNDAHRGAAWDFVHARLAADGWPVMEGYHDRLTWEQWCKAVAVEDALHHAGVAGDDVMVMMDADVLVDLQALRAAVAVVEAGEVEWAVPHRHVLRLDELSTDVVLSGAHLPRRFGLTRDPYVGVAGGGCVVLRRSTYDDCPLDHRFLGWGDEDLCWGWALECLHGGPWRAIDDLLHLWHPHAAPGAQRGVARSSQIARRQYRAARRIPERMRVAIDAGR